MADAASLSSLPRSAHAQTATKADFLQLVVAAVGANYHDVTHAFPEKSDMEKSDMVGLCKSFLAACLRRRNLLCHAGLHGEPPRGMVPHSSEARGLKENELY